MALFTRVKNTFGRPQKLGQTMHRAGLVQQMQRTMSSEALEGYDATQVELMKENLIVCDEQDNVVGKCSKKEGHLRSFLDKENSLPHRAFSCFLFNEKNELLLQRRSSHKITFPNMWTIKRFINLIRVNNK